MESWSDVVTSYPETHEPKDYAKAIRSAEIILGEDLAPFETEWLAQTLLFKPVDLFETISSKRANEDWLKTIADSFKILSKLVEKCWDVVENYYNDIITLCMLPFDPQTRKDALLCLINVAKHPSAVLSEEVINRHVSALEEAKTCKAPRALLVGTICRYHPELVQEHFTRIWRIYLNMLQPNNKTDQVVNSVLQGINGLFEHFGDDIEIEQINRFYDTMSREFIKIAKCLDVLLSIFKHHGRLFKERLSKDRPVRLYLWQIDTNPAMEALSNIYEVVLPMVQNKEEIIKSEVLPRLESPSILIKHTALRIIIQAGSAQSMEVPTICSGVELEYQLRTKKLSYEEANTVSWCIVSSVANSETMLLTAIMFYDNLPTLKKKDIVVNGILKASDDVRKAALILLLKLSLQDDLDKYIDIWRALLDNTSGTDLEIRKAMVIFEETVHHILEVLTAFTGDSEKVYEDIKPILSLMSTLLSLHKVEFNTERWCYSIRPTIAHLATLCATDAASMISENIENQTIYVEKFEEDTVLNKLLSTLTTTSDVSQDGTLSAFQTIFSSEDTDYKVMSKALSKLENLIESENNNLDKRLLSLILNNIYKIKSKNVTDTKDARVFQKDATMFLGKYGHMTEEESFSEDIYVLKLKNKVTLNKPNIIEGTTFKIDLQRVLQLCLLRGDTEALYSLLVILSASLCDRTDPGLQEATVRVIHALFRTNIGRSHPEIAVYPALLMCNTSACVPVLMKGIIEELTPTVRRKLSDSLQVLLTHEPGSETTTELLNIVAEQTACFMNTDETSVSGLEIIRAFLSAINDNNSLIIDHLPDILIYTANIQNGAVEIFEMSTNLFIEKLDLFTDTQIKEIVQKILEKYATNTARESNLNKIIVFTKTVMEVKKFEAAILVEMTLEMCQKLTVKSPQFLNLVTLLALLNNAFELNSEIRRKVVVYKNCLVLQQLLEIQFDEGDSKINAVLVFLKEYAEDLIEVDAERTLQCLGYILENIPASSVLPLKNNLTACFSIYKSNQNYSPTIQISYEKWSKKLELQQITECIEEKTLFTEFTEKYSVIIHAVKILSEIVQISTPLTKKWTKILLKNATELELKWGRIFLTDLLSISERTLSDYEFNEILENNLDFVKNYVSVYFKRLISKPFILKGEQSSLLVDVVEFFGKSYNEDLFQNVLELVAHLWPTFLHLTTFDDKLSVLLNLLRLPKSVGLDCPAVVWATTLLTAEGTSQEDSIKLIGALPAGEEYSSYYRKFASGLPVRLSEMQGRYVPRFRALLDSLATNGDMTLLDIVITLAGGDDTKGWWDHAIDTCMAALASKDDINVFDNAYKKAKKGVNLGVCNRIFLPLLRHSSRKFCERYISTIVTDLFDILRVGFKEATNTEAYRKRVVSYAIAFNVLKVAFEKITTEALENGPINEKAGSQKPWYFLEQTCMYCVTISTKVKCPSNASAELKETCLWLHCSSYACFASAICRRKLSKSLSARLFNVHAWTNIVDKEAVYLFELQAHARYRGTKPAKRSVDALATSSSFTGTIRSRLFLTTLSENPLQYDMIPEDEDDDEEEEDTSQDFEDSVLNAHGCLTTLTTLLEHASTVEHTEWRSVVVTALTTDVTVNVKWLLAQAICNAFEELKPHASVLCPALLKLIADTPIYNDERPVLNNLHVDIISTIIKWNLTELPHDPNMNKAVEYIINTCISYKHHTGIHKRMLITLNSLLQVYGKMVTVKWTVFQDYCVDTPKDIIPLLPIFERLLKNDVALQELLPAIFANLNGKHWTGNSKLAEVTGLAFCMADTGTRQAFLPKFWQILNCVRGLSVNGYVKMLFYAQKGYTECCDFQQLKIITDLAPKVEKSKCLTIISSYLENSTEYDDFYSDMYQIISLNELFDTELRIEAMKIARNSLKLVDEAMRWDVLKGIELNCRSSGVNVRREAFGVFLTAFQALFKRETHNPFKRKAVDSSPILNTIDSQSDYEKLVLKKIFDGMFDVDEGVAKMMSDGVEECLSKDINMRFAELFYILIYQCSLATNNNYELSNCGSKLLTLLFSDLSSQEAFKVIMLRDEGLPQSLLRAYDSLSVRTKTMARTVLRSGVTYRQRIAKAPAKRDIDVKMSIADILNVFLQLSKKNSQVCQELCVQMMKCLQGTGRRFDLDSVIAKQLFHIITRDPFCLTPLVLDACRIFVKDVSSIAGFSESVKVLKQAVRNSEGYLYTNILFEDLQLRSGDRDQFIFSMFKEDTDTPMRDDEFTLEGLIQAFGSLSNWGDLKLQDKRQIEDTLPPLWTSNEHFTVCLREYFDGANKKLDYNHWFNKMVASYYSEEVTQNRISWLKQTEKWPRRDFATSAVIEAIQWHQNETNLFGNISSTDCLAEWAGRLMIRTSYYTRQQQSQSDSEERVSFNNHQLLCCRQATDSKLPSLALHCVDNNKDNLLDTEILPWVQEKVKAYRILGLRENNLNSLEKALEAAEKQTVRFASQSSFETKVSMQKLILELHHDLGSLSRTTLDNAMQTVSAHIIRLKGRMMSSNDAEVLKSLYDTTMLYYDELWIENDEQAQNAVIQRMTEIIDKVLDYNLTTDCNLLICVILNRLAYCETTISDETARSLLEQIYRIFHRLDFFSIAILKKVLAVLPAHVINDNYLNKLQDTDLDVCKEYFQLICDANYSLLHYVYELRKNILDDTEWDTIFNRMKKRLFETKYGGTDYRSLNTIKNKLYALEDMTDIDSKAKELKQIINELSTKPQRPTLRLSQLCPDLCSSAILDRNKVHLQRLLRLPPNVYVVKFSEQISVFTDSVRRPCVVRALLSNGATRRFICKSGEPMYRDASVQRAMSVLPAIDHKLLVRSYNVTPLSDDSAIIEYLEDHVRLRDLMEEKHDINVAAPKAGYEKLILAPSLAMEQYNAMCDKVTLYVLRSSIESNCSCVEEFITKKRTFEDTLSSMTIFNWLFGVGDRHLQNIMYSMRDGGVCGVDWASIFQYGCQELPPARLTANLLAVCDVKVLESRLQRMLLSLRESQKLFEAFIRTSFYWSGPEFNELKHISKILQGKAVSYEITRECIEESEKKYKNEYVRLLDQVFENFVPKDVYSVEEQVSCLLQHCTEPRILSVTQPGWEAWL